MEERRIDFSGLLQYLHNGKSSVSGINFITVPSSIKLGKLIVNLLVRQGASKPTALLASNGSENSFWNEFSIKIDSQSDYIQRSLSLAEELDKDIKDEYAQMQTVRFETLSSKIQKEMTLYENGGRRGDYLERTYSYLMTVKCLVWTSLFFSW